MVEKDELRGHSFDGIQEYDNDLPRWWLNIFWLTAIYSVVYIAWAHFGFKEPDGDRLARRMKELEALQPAEEAAPAGTTISSLADNLLELTADTDALKRGKEVFDGKCASCHRADGGGLVGPNLTDDFWIHGGAITDIRTIIINGVPQKGMLAWKALLPPDDINAVTAYIWTLRGSNPQNPKAPEGEPARAGDAAADAVGSTTEEVNDSAH